MENVAYQECVLNIRDELPSEIWENLTSVYEQMPGWLGFGNGEQGEENIPYWFSFKQNEKSISASVEMSGLQIVGYNFTKESWSNWISEFKKLTTEILGFKVGEIELGEVGYEIEWINPPSSMIRDNKEVKVNTVDCFELEQDSVVTDILKIQNETDSNELATKKKPWWKFW